MVNLWDEDSGLRVKQPAQEKQSLGGLVGLDKANSVQAAPTGNGIQTAGNKQANPYQTGNGYGIRNILTGGGIANNDVDWNGNNGMVTLYGNDFYKPDRVVDGVSYVDDPSKLLKAMGESGNAATNAAVQGYKNIYGKNVVQATDYLANKGTNFQADWNNGNLMVNGIPVKHEFVLGGKAYVDSAELDKAIAQAQEAAGVQNEADILQKYKDKYWGKLEQMVNDYDRRKDFSYDPLDDPAYLAYRDMYNREGDRAMRDAMGAAQAASGGYMNSAAAIAAAQQNNYYTQQLNDRVPELMQFAYQRYADDLDRDVQAYNMMNHLMNNQYQTEYGVNQDIINRINYNNQLDEARDDKAYERYWDEQDIKHRWDYDNTLLADQLKNSEENRAATNANTESQKLQNILARAMQTNTWPAGAENYFDTSVEPREYAKWMTDEELRAFQTKSDIGLAADKDLAAYNTGLQKELAAYNSGLDWDLYQKQYGLQSGERYTKQTTEALETAVKNINSIYKDEDGKQIIISDGGTNYRFNPNIDKSAYIDAVAKDILSNGALSQDIKEGLFDELGIGRDTVERIAKENGFS